MGDRRSLYSILGVEPTAEPDEIRDAFRRLARERHPDRFQGLERLSAEKEFQAITEAYNVLSDPQRRASYDQMAALGGPRQATDPREIARVLLVKATAAVRRKDVAQAEELFRQAVGHDPQSAKAQHLYAMFLAETLGRLDEALRHVDQASKLDPLNPKVLLDASRLFASAGMMARAERLARSAAELSPDDERVESWLRRVREERARG